MRYIQLGQTEPVTPTSPTLQCRVAYTRFQIAVRVIVAKINNKPSVVYPDAGAWFEFNEAKKRLLQDTTGCQLFDIVEDQLVQTAIDSRKIREGGTTPAPITRVQCGSVLCPEGFVCCNASCGICTRPGETCIETTCGPTNSNGNGNGGSTTNDDWLADFIENPTVKQWAPVVLLAAAVFMTWKVVQKA